MGRRGCWARDGEGGVTVGIDMHNLVLFLRRVCYLVSHRFTSPSLYQWILFTWTIELQTQFISWIVLKIRNNCPCGHLEAHVGPA